MKKTIIITAFIIMLLAFSAMASAVRFDVEKARQEEWERYEQYREEYIDFHDLEGYEQYVSERNLRNNFGFYRPEHYYIPPHVWAAKYNPPLQAETYCTNTRGCGSSLNQPSAVQFYAQKNNGRLSGFVRSTTNGRYFDHPHANTRAYAGATGYITLNHPGTYQGYAPAYYNTERPAYYARIAEPANNQDFYIVGFY